MVLLLKILTHLSNNELPSMAMHYSLKLKIKLKKKKKSLLPIAHRIQFYYLLPFLTDTLSPYPAAQLPPTQGPSLKFLFASTLPLMALSLSSLSSCYGYGGGGSFFILVVVVVVVVFDFAYGFGGLVFDFFCSFFFFVVGCGCHSGDCGWLLKF